MQQTFGQPWSLEGRARPAVVSVVRRIGSPGPQALFSHSPTEAPPAGDVAFPLVQRERPTGYLLQHIDQSLEYILRAWRPVAYRPRIKESGTALSGIIKNTCVCVHISHTLFIV